MILAWLYQRRRTVAVALGILLFFSVTVPIAVYAASSSYDTEAPDYEILDTVPGDRNVISASLAGNKFDVPTEEATTAGDPDEGEEPSDSDVKPETGSVYDTEEPTEQPDDSEQTDQAGQTDDSGNAQDTTEPAATEPPTEETTEDLSVYEFYVTVGFYDREAITCLTGPATLRQILYSAGYELREGDRPTVSLDEMITGESWIMIDSVTYEAVTVSESIPFEVETYEVQTVPRGTTQTVTYGVNGSLDKVYTVEYVNGVETNRYFEYEYVSALPQNQIDYYGTGGTFYASDGTAYSYSYYVNVRATYYNIHGNTASGLPTSNSVMAVDPSVFPLGTQVYVMNDYYDMGVKIAADTGGAVVGNIIDIWMDENHPHYYEFANQGVCDMIAYVLD